MVKNLPTSAGAQVLSLAWEDPTRHGTAKPQPKPVLSAGEAAAVRRPCTRARAQPSLTTGAESGAKQERASAAICKQANEISKSLKKKKKMLLSAHPCLYITKNPRQV